MVISRFIDVLKSKEGMKMNSINKLSGFRYCHEELATGCNGVNTMRREWKLVLAIAVIMLTVPLEILADENEHKIHDETHRHKHHLAVFVGGTHAEIEEEGHGGEEVVREESEDAFTAGVDYEYRLKSLFGVGGIVEYSGGDLEATVAAGALFIHPIGGLKLILAPGVENKGDENKFLFRTGVYYDFFFGKFSVGPTFSVDFVDGEQNLIYGLSFGYGF